MRSSRWIGLNRFGRNPRGLQPLQVSQPSLGPLYALQQPDDRFGERLDPLALRAGHLHSLSRSERVELTRTFATATVGAWDNRRSAARSVIRPTRRPPSPKMPDS